MHPLHPLHKLLNVDILRLIYVYILSLFVIGDIIFSLSLFKKVSFYKVFYKLVICVRPCNGYKGVDPCNVGCNTPCSYYNSKLL